MHSPNQFYVTLLCDEKLYFVTVGFTISSLITDMFTSLIEMAEQFSLLPIATNVPIATGVPWTFMHSQTPLSNTPPSSSDFKEMAVSSTASEPYESPDEDTQSYDVSINESTFLLYLRSGQSEDTDSNVLVKKAKPSRVVDTC